MPRVTAIRTQRRRTDRVSVYVDEAFWASLPITAVGELGLRSGLELTDAELAHVAVEAQRHGALQRGFELLASRPQSRAELRRKLAAKGYAPPAIEASLARLEELRLVDDNAFAAMVVRDAVTFGRSRRQARERLRRFGVADADVALALETEYPDGVEEEAARTLVLRRVSPTEAATREGRERAVRLVRSRGFGAPALAAALAALGAHADRADARPAPKPRRGSAPPAPDLDELRRLVDRRYADHRTDRGARRRALAFLARRGVHGSEAQRVLGPGGSQS